MGNVRGDLLCVTGEHWENVVFPLPLDHLGVRVVVFDIPELLELLARRFRHCFTEGEGKNSKGHHALDVLVVYRDELFHDRLSRDAAKLQ